MSMSYMITNEKFIEILNEYDALEHRMHRNEMTAKDLIEIYQHKKENKYV